MNQNAEIFFENIKSQAASGATTVFCPGGRQSSRPQTTNVP